MSTDPQSRAFRDAADADRWDDDIDTLVAVHGAARHPPTTDVSQIRLPDDYEAAGWDAGREGPKTPTEARAALAARIADPAAPDTDAEAGAYDEDSA